MGNLSCVSCKSETPKDPSKQPGARAPEEFSSLQATAQNGTDDSVKPNLGAVSNDAQNEQGTGIIAKIEHTGDEVKEEHPKRESKVTPREEENDIEKQPIDEAANVGQAVYDHEGEVNLEETKSEVEHTGKGAEVERIQRDKPSDIREKDAEIEVEQLGTVHTEQGENGANIEEVTTEIKREDVDNDKLEGEINESNEQADTGISSTGVEDKYASSSETELDVDLQEEMLSSVEKEKPAIRSLDDVRVSLPGEKRISGWELYEVLREHRIKEEDDNNLNDLEKAAKAIVDLNVFLASQVIYPAYLRYLEEDHPELYTQYFARPESPTPPYSESPIDRDHKETFEQLSTSEEEDYEGSRKHAEIKGKTKRSVQFDMGTTRTIPYAPDDILEYMYDADEEDTEMIWSSELTTCSKDSIELLKRHTEKADVATMVEKFSDSSLEEVDESMKEAANTLKKVLKQLAHGDLSPNQVDRLVALAREILGEGPEDTESMHFAEKTVREAITNVHREFIGDQIYFKMLEEGIVDEAQTTSVLAKYIVNNAVSLAIDELHRTSSVESKQERPGSAPITAAKSSDISMRSNLTDAGRYPQPEMKSTVSDLVLGVLSRVAKSVHDHISVGSSAPSDTALLVKRAISEAARDIKSHIQWPQEDPVLWENATPLKKKSSSVTGQFVLDTLREAVHEIDEEGTYLPKRKDSAFERFAEALVHDTLDNCLKDLQRGTMSTEELTTLTTAIIQSQQLIRPGTKPGSGIHLASNESAMLEDLIKSALSKAKTSLSKSHMIQISTQTDLRGLLRELDKRSTCTEGRSDTSVLADECLVEAIENVAMEIYGDIPEKQSQSSSEVVKDLVEEILQTAAADLIFRSNTRVNEGEAELAVRSALSITAEALVRSAVDDILENLPSSSREMSSMSAQNLLATARSAELTTFIERLISDATKILTEEESTSLRSIKSAEISNMVSKILVEATKSEMNSATSNPDHSEVRKTSSDNEVHGKSSSSSAESETGIGLIAKDSLQTSHSSSLRNVHSQDTELKEVKDAMSGTSNLGLKTNDSLEHLHNKGLHGSHTVTPESLIQLVPDDEHLVLDALHYIEDSSEDEAPLVPMFGDHEAHIDHHLIEHALSILAIKRDEDLKVISPVSTPCQRTSFRDLTHPDITRLKRFHSGPEEAMCHSVESMSSRKLVLGSFHSAPCGVHPEKIEEKNESETESEDSPVNDSLEVVVSNAFLHNMDGNDDDLNQEQSEASKSNKQGGCKTKTEKATETSNKGSRTSQIKRSEKSRRSSLPLGLLESASSRFKHHTKPSPSSPLHDAASKPSTSVKETAKQSSKTKVKESLSKKKVIEKRSSIIAKAFAHKSPSKKDSAKEDKHSAVDSKKKSKIQMEQEFKTNKSKTKIAEKETSLQSEQKEDAKNKIETQEAESIQEIQTEDADKEVQTVCSKESPPPTSRNKNGKDSNPQTPEEDIHYGTITYTRSGSGNVVKKLSGVKMKPLSKLSLSSSGSSGSSTSSLKKKVSSEASPHKTGSAGSRHKASTLAPRLSDDFKQVSPSGSTKSISSRVSQGSLTSTSKGAVAKRNSSDKFASSHKTIVLSPKASLSNILSKTQAAQNGSSEEFTHSDQSREGQVDHHRKEKAQCCTGSWPAMHTGDEDPHMATEFKPPSYPNPKRSTESTTSRTSVPLTPKSSISSFGSVIKEHSQTYMLTHESASKAFTHSDEKCHANHNDHHGSYHHHLHGNHHHGRHYHHDEHEAQDLMHTSTGSLPGLDTDHAPQSFPRSTNVDTQGQTVNRSRVTLADQSPSAHNQPHGQSSSGGTGKD